MRCVVQRVTEASVSVDNETVGAIGRGIMVLIGVSSEDGEADLIAWTTPGEFEVGAEKPELAEELAEWYHPDRIAAAKKEEQELLTVKKVRRRIFSPMLDKRGGIISHYDQYFVAYSRDIRWDW